MPDHARTDAQQVSDVEEIKRLADLIAKDSRRRILYKAMEGLVDGEGVWVEPPGEGDLYPGGAIMRAEHPPGTLLETHVQDHGCTEYLIVVGGQLEVTVWEDDQQTVRERIRLGPTDSIRLEPGRPHEARAMERTIVFSITIPRDGGYPDGPGPGSSVRPEDG